MATRASALALPYTRAATTAKPAAAPEAAVFAGFTASDLAAHYGISKEQAGAIGRLASGGKTQADRDIVSTISPSRLKSIQTGQGNLSYLAEHYKGSHYSGDFSVGNVLANFATGGLYGVGKGALKAINTGKVSAGAADALASYGTAGSVLQPTVGTKKALLIEAAIGGGAYAAGPGAGAAGGAGTTGVESGVAGTGAASATGAAEGTTLGITGSQLATGATLAAAGASVASPLLTKTPKLPSFDPAAEKAKADQAARDAANKVQSREAEARRQRRAKGVQSALTGGMGVTGFAPVQTPTLQPGQARKSVLG